MGVTERRYYYSVGSRKSPVAHVWVTVRTLQTGARIVFARMTANARKTVPVAVTLTSPARSFATHNLGLRANLKYDQHSGVDRTSGPYGWVTLATGAKLDRDVFLSKAYRFKTLKKSYGKGKTSTIKALVSEKTLLSVGRRKDHTAQIALGLSATGDSCERYFLVAPYSVADTATTPALIAKTTRDNARWLDPYGPYGKSSYSTEPPTKVGYAHSLLLMRATDFRGVYQATGSPLFRDLLLNGVYTLSLIRSADGLWRTDYTSTWVKGESGITAPYVDTRHNESLALAAPKIADALNARGIHLADSIRGWASPYATFLSRRAAANAVIHTKHGYYFADYYDASGRAKCHASLNHSLGEMNYLLDLCGSNTSTPLFGVAMKIKAAVDDCGTQWIAPNKDLYYERKMNGHYEGVDYPTVTYMDLLNSQQLFTAVLGKRDPIFDKLIASKASYLGISSLSQPPAVSAPLAGAQPPSDVSELP